MATDPNSVGFPRLAIYACTAGHWHTPVIEPDDGGGTRMLVGKCCPNQYGRLVVAWHLTPERVDDFVNALECALETRGQEGPDGE